MSTAAKKRIHPVLWACALLAIVSQILAVIGFSIYYTKESLGICDLAYRSLQLFTFTGTATLTPPLNDPLEAARWLAPISTLSAGILAASVVFRRGFDRLRVRFWWWSGHAVICGVGARGERYAAQFLADGKKVVLVDRETSHEVVERLRRLGALFIVGDATDLHVLRAAGAHKARWVVSVLTKDGDNTDVAALVRELRIGGSTQPVSCYAHVNDPMVCRVLREQEVITPNTPWLRVEYFNVHEQAARGLFARHLEPLLRANASQAKTLRICVLGQSPAVNQVVLTIAREVQASTGNVSAVHLTLVAPGASCLVAALSLYGVHATKRLALCPSNIDTEEYLTAAIDDASFRRRSEQAFDVWLVASESPAKGWALGMRLSQTVASEDSQVLVLAEKPFAFGKLIAGSSSASHVDAAVNICDFNADACRLDLLLEDTNEVLARAVHLNYLRLRLAEEDVDRDDPALLPWESLPEQLRESNRQQAKDAARKLEAIGYEIVIVLDAEAGERPLPMLSDDEFERMAELEHERWLEERAAQGWKWGREKDHERRTSPSIVPYGELSEETKNFDRDAVRRIPELLRTVGLGVRRRMHGNFVIRASGLAR